MTGEPTRQLRISVALTDTEIYNLRLLLERIRVQHALTVLDYLERGEEMPELVGERALLAFLHRALLAIERARRKAEVAT